MDFSLYFFSATGQVNYGERYKFIIEAAKYIDQNGFRAIWTPERHFQEFGGSFPNPSVLSAALATITKNIELRAGSIALPLHHPIRVVEEWSLVDQLSNGRTALCIATGWYRGDFVLTPSNYVNRREIAFEGVQILRDLWEGKEVIFEGVDGQQVPIRTFPRPVSSELPIWLVYSQNPQTWMQAGKIGANVLCLLNSYDQLKTNIELYRNELAKHGHDPQKGIVTVALHTFVHDDDVAVKKLVEKPVTVYLEKFLNQRNSDANLQGNSKEVSEMEKALLSQLAFDDMYEKRSLLGSMTKCVDLVGRLRDIGVNEIAALVDFGLDFDQVLNALPRITELKEAFSDSIHSTIDFMDKPVDLQSWYFERPSLNP